MIRKFVKRMERIIPSSSDEAVEECRKVLLGGGVVSLPTDTVYGLATLLPSVHKLYSIKGRDPDKPVAICVKDIPEIHKWAKVGVSDELLNDLLPGPVTLLFPRSPSLLSCVNPGVSLVGVRIPPHPFVGALTPQLPHPLALTSANLSSHGSTLRIQEFESIWHNIDLIIDGGELEDVEKRREGSTVVDLSCPGSFAIIRNGSALEETIKILSGTKHKLTERKSNGLLKSTELGNKS